VQVAKLEYPAPGFKKYFCASVNKNVIAELEVEIGKKAEHLVIATSVLFRQYTR